MRSESWHGCRVYGFRVSVIFRVRQIVPGHKSELSTVGFSVSGRQVL